MSQRKLDRIDRTAGGLAGLRRRARQMGVHLLLLTNDEGVELVVASTYRQKVVC